MMGDRRYFCLLLAVVVLQLVSVVVVTQKPRTCKDIGNKGGVELLKCEIGGRLRLACEYKNVQWMKDGAVLSRDKNTRIKRRQVSSVLIVQTLESSNSGFYTCSSNGSIISKWNLTFIPGRRIRTTKEPCSHQTGCKSGFSACKTTARENSYPGKPRNVTMDVQLHGTKAVVLVKWENPDIGLSDLCGYQVDLLGLKGHAGHSQCYQINKSNGSTGLCQAFWRVKFGAEYQVQIRSFPEHPSGKNRFIAKVVTQEKCDMPEFWKLFECCSPVGLEGKAKSNGSSGAGHIDVSWEFRCNISVERFYIRWTNLQNPKECRGKGYVMYKNGSRYHYVIALNEQCFHKITPCNYTVRVSGMNEKMESETSNIIVSILRPTVAASSVTQRQPPPVEIVKIAVAAAGALLGVCLLAFIYCHFFRPVTMVLPQPSTPPSTPEGHPSEESQLVSPAREKSRVFIMHTKCCEKCTWVTNCLGFLLNSTGMIEVSLDTWNMQDIAPNVAGWYENQIRSNEYVLVLVSHKMFLRSTGESHNEDPLPIKFQLSLVRGEIADEPDTPKYVPVYFTYNSSKQDIPACMSPRWAHRLLTDIDRLVFHLTRVEEVRPYRTQPVVVIAADGHPYGDKKRDLESAVRAAADHHQAQQQNNSQTERAGVVAT